jgi:class 3 adenylate cyclase
VSTSDFQPSVRTVLASFLFVDIVGFSKVPAARQHALKAGLIAVLHRHLGILHIGDFRLRDTGDGALLSFLSNPEHALYMALAVADDLSHATGENQLALTDLRTGINLGAVKESLDVESRPNYVGDGINAAQRIMDFAQPGQITASRSFMEAVSQLDAAYEALFSHLGAMADKHGRKHELFAIAPSETVLRRLRSDILVARPPQIEVDFDLDRLAPPVVLPSRPPAAPAAAAPLASAPLAAASAVPAESAAPEFASTHGPQAEAATPAVATRGRPVLWLGLVAVVLSAVLGVLIARWFDHSDPPVPAAMPTATPPAGAAASDPAPAASGDSAAVPAAPQGMPASAPAAVPATRASSEAPVAVEPSPAATPPAMNAPVASTPRAAASAGAPAARPAPRKPAAEAPTKALPAAATPAADPAPALSDQARQRCSRIMQKVGIGEPLTAEEKNILANSCR